MTTQIKEGDRVPDFTFLTLQDDAPVPITTKEIFSGKKVVLLAVPGAFTPTCSRTHCPGFAREAVRLKEKGFSVVCTAVNDAFVLDAWAESQHAKGKILFVADGSASFAKSVGMVLDLTERGLGLRSRRYAMVVDDGVVKYLGVDDKGVEKSSVEAVLAKL